MEEFRQQGRIAFIVNCVRRVHTRNLSAGSRGSPWGGKKGMRPETHTLAKQPYPVRFAADLATLPFTARGGDTLEDGRAAMALRANSLVFIRGLWK